MNNVKLCHFELETNAFGYSFQWCLKQEENLVKKYQVGWIKLDDDEDATVNNSKVNKRKMFSSWQILSNH